MVATLDIGTLAVRAAATLGFGRGSFPARPAFRRAPLALPAALGVWMFTPAHVEAQPVQWIQRSNTGPSPRWGHAMAYDSARRVAVLFGGYTASGPYNGETWEWNGTVWTQRLVLGGPSPRSQHAMAYDSSRGVTVLFGGYPSGVNGETWEWNGTTWTQRLVTGPEPRYLHSMTYDSARGVSVLFGGWTNRTVGDTWEWDGTNWTARDSSGPAPRWNHAMAFDSSRGVSVLFGGVPPVLGDTWEWNGTSWVERPADGPSARYLHAMAYDSARGVTVLFGGIPDPGAQTWDWSGEAWSLRTSGAPAPRHAHAMCFDTARGVTVLFGGWTGAAYYRDTWELRVPCTAPAITVHPVDQAVCPGAPVSLTVSADGTGPLAYQWRHGSPPSPIPGATSDTYTIEAVTATDAGPYDCVVSNACGNVTSDAGTLTICMADFNCDVAINTQDFFDFLTAFFASAARADLNGDTHINSQDFFDFVAAFFAGC